MGRTIVALAVLVVLSGSTDAATPKLHGNNFYANCLFSHTNDDDPIVFPGQPGRSHPHTFFGNKTTDASSTLASLRGAPTTCKPRADHGAYWVPTLFQNGHEVRPYKGQFYYNLRGYDQMRAFPLGLKVVAGDSHATSPQPLGVVWWQCGGSGGVKTKPAATVPARCPMVHASFKVKEQRCATCPLTPATFRANIQTHLELHVNFPDCWDGKHLDSPDHHSHMAYSRNYVCPSSHPVKVPLIRLNIRYPILDNRGVALSSGGQLTGHADFVNTWNEKALVRLVDDCFHDRPCNEPKPKG